MNPQSDSKLSPQKRRSADRLRPLRYLLRIPMLLIHIVLVILVAALLSFPGTKRSMIRGVRADYWLIQWWSHGMVRLFGIRIETVGRAHPDPVLWVSNHVSWLDIEVLHAIRAVAFLSKAEVRHWPLLGHLARLGGTVFHKRGSTASLKASTESLTQRLQEGRSVALFPEGRTGPGDRVLTFHARMFQVAADASAPVQPVALEYRNADGINVDLGFRDEEQFVPNLVRVMGDPPSIVRVHFLPVISSEQDRKTMAIAAHAAVSEALGFAH